MRWWWPRIEMSGERAPVRWTQWTPGPGWAGFDAHRALSDAIWSGLSEADGVWQYMNFSQDHSIWEHRADGSEIVIQYRGERIDSLHSSAGEAQGYLRAALVPFGLIAQEGPAP